MARNWSQVAALLVCSRYPQGRITSRRAGWRLGRLAESAEEASDVSRATLCRKLKAYGLTELASGADSAP